MDADLELSLSAATQNLDVGGETTLTLTVYNQGPSTAEGVEVAFLLPESLDVLEVTPSDDTDSYDPESGLWTVGTLSMDMLTPVPQASIEIRVQATSADTLDLFAEVYQSDNPDPDSTPSNGAPEEDDAAALTLVVQEAASIDLKLSMSADRDEVAPGDPLRFALTYVNAGATARGVVLSDEVPTATTFEASASTPGWQVDETGTYTFSLGTLQPGASGTAVFAVLVDEEVPEDMRSIVNTARIADDGSQGADALPGDNETTVAVPLDRPATGSADLSLLLTFESDSAVVGEPIMADLLLSNRGPDSAEAIEVEVMRPAGLAYVSHSGDGTYEPEAARWSVDAAPPDAESVLSVRYRVEVAGSSTVVAQVASAQPADPDSQPGAGGSDEDDYAAATIIGFPGAPVLVMPEDGATVDAVRPTLVWEDVLGADAYDVQVADVQEDGSASFDAPVFEALGLTETSARVDSLERDAGYHWRVRARSAAVEDPGTWSDAFGFVTSASTVGAEAGDLPQEPLGLRPVYPNPVRHRSTVAYHLGRSGHVNVEVFDALGRRQSTLLDGWHAPGTHRVSLQAEGMRSGVYVICLRMGELVERRAVVVIR